MQNNFTSICVFCAYTQNRKFKHTSLKSKLLVIFLCWVMTKINICKILPQKMWYVCSSSQSVVEHLQNSCWFWWIDWSEKVNVLVVFDLPRKRECMRERETQSAWGIWLSKYSDISQQEMPSWICLLAVCTSEGALPRFHTLFSLKYLKCTYICAHFISKFHRPWLLRSYISISCKVNLSENLFRLGTLCYLLVCLFVSCIGTCAYTHTRTYMGVFDKFGSYHSGADSSRTLGLDCSFTYLNSIACILLLTQLWMHRIIYPYLEWWRPTII